MSTKQMVDFQADQPTTSAIVDADVHEMMPSIRALLPYLAREWHQFIDSGWSYPFFFSYGYPTEAGFARADAVPESGPAGSDFDLMREQLLDPFSVEVAILTSLFFPGDMRVQYQFGNALASAYNDWITEEWLSRDPRLRGSVCVNVNDPEAAGAEIDRVGARAGYVQVMLGPNNVGYGETRYDPIFAAAARNGLNIGLHPSARANTALGYPELLAEWRTLGPVQHLQSHLVSIVMHGVLERYPDLRVTFIESGWTWLPHLLWRIDENYRSLRMEVPWLKLPPSDYIHRQVRFTSQPMEMLTADQFTSILELMGGDHMLLFSSDYPHWDFDSPMRGFPANLPADVVRKVQYQNAKDWYRL